MKRRGDDSSGRLASGILYLVASAFFLALLSVFSRAAGDLPVMQKSLVKNSLSLVIATAGFVKSGAGFRLEKKSCLLPLLSRGVFGAIGSIAYLYVSDHLLLADATILSKTVPFITIVLCFFFLKEPIHVRQLGCLVLGFLGTLLVIQPTMGTKDPLALAIGMGGFFCSAVAYTCIRYLGLHGVSKYLTVFVFTVTQILISLSGLLAGFEPMTAKQVAFLFLAGACATLAQLCVTTAYTYCSAGDISVFDYTGVIFSAILGFLFFDQLPDLLSICGYAVIFLAALLLLRVNKRLHNGD